MKLTLLDGACTEVERDALRRIRSAARRGWSCRLKVYHAAAILHRVDEWAARGLRGAAAVRIRAAHRDMRGVRLTVDECRDITITECSRDK